MPDNFRSVLARVLLGASFMLVALGATAAGPKAYVGNFNDNTVSVIDTASGAVVATVPVAAGPHGMAATPDGRTVYVSGDGSSTVSVIDASADKVARTIDVGKTPHGLAVTPDGRTLLAAVYGEDRIAFVDTASQAIVATVPVAKPHTIAIRPDGKVAYVSSQEPGKFALVVVDIPTRAALRSIALEKPPSVNAVQVLDPASDKIVGQITTGASPHIASVFRGATVGTVVVQGPGELLLFNPATNAPVRSIAVGKQPHWMAATSDAKSVYVTNEGSNDVTVVEMATGHTRTIAVGKAPRKVVIQRVASGGGAAKTATADPKVSIANFAFAPEAVTIAVGDAVTWTNDDAAPHGLAFKDGAQGTGSLLPGANFSRTYDKPGTYDYVCAVHPFMTGKVIVRAP